MRGTIGDLLDECHSQLGWFKPIITTSDIGISFIVLWNGTWCQMSVSCTLISLKNYVCKMQNEVLSAHFGASKKQISLHTGVYYVGHDGEANTFCTISESLQHGPAAIWAHLDTVLNLIQNKHPEIDTIHYFSDGPCTQYKQKANVFLFTHRVSKGYDIWNLELFWEWSYEKESLMGWVPPLGECLTALFTKEVTAKMPLMCIQTWKVPTAKFNSTLYQQRSLKFQLKPCCQWLTWRLSQLVFKLWYCSRRYFISRDTYRSKLPIRSNNNGRGWKCTLDRANLYQARPIWFITWKESLA